MYKRGISTEVASILIVLVTIVGVTILWMSLDTFLNQDVRPFNTRLSIITSTGYTFYDPDEKTVMVQISVDSGEYPDYVQLILILEDGSELISVHDAPLPNSRKILLLDVSDRYTQGSRPVKASVAPIYIIEDKAVVGNRINPVSLPVRGEDETYYSSFGDPSAPNGADISAGPLASGGGGGGGSSGDASKSHGTPPDLCPLVTECEIIDHCFDETIDKNGKTFYTVCTCEDLAQISFGDEEKVNFILMHNIDCRGILEDPIGGVYYGGEYSDIIQNFDGNGKTLSHVLLDKGTTGQFSNPTALGLFSYYRGNIYNLTLENVTIKGEGFEVVGGLVGYLLEDGTINNVKSKQSRETFNSVVSTAQQSNPGGTNVGGLVGQNRGTINASNFRGIVTGASSVGGLVGTNDALINNSYAVVSMSVLLTNGGGLVGTNSVEGVIDLSDAGMQLVSLGNDLGGLVGRNDGVINRSYFSGDIRGNRYIGGLVGTSTGIIERSYATGDVFGSEDIGGLVGRLSGQDITNGFQREGKIISSYSSMDVGSTTLTSKRVGGLVGLGIDTCQIMYSYSNGDLNGESSIGGLVGRLSGCTLEESYSRSRLEDLSGSSNVNLGGLIGLDNGNNVISISYYDTTVNTCNQIPPEECYDASLYGVLSEDLQENRDFLKQKGWDFVDTDGDPAVWKFDTSISEYAVLDWQDA